MQPGLVAATLLARSPSGRARAGLSVGEGPDAPRPGRLGPAPGRLVASPPAGVAAGSERASGKCVRSSSRATWPRGQRPSPGVSGGKCVRRRRRARSLWERRSPRAPPANGCVARHPGDRPADGAVGERPSPGGRRQMCAKPSRGDPRVSGASVPRAPPANGCATQGAADEGVWERPSTGVPGRKCVRSAGGWPTRACRSDGRLGLRPQTGARPSIQATGLPTGLSGERPSPGAGANCVRSPAGGGPPCIGASVPRGPAANGCATQRNGAGGTAELPPQVTALLARLEEADAFEVAAYRSGDVRDQPMEGSPMEGSPSGSREAKRRA
jgi:hypothetical protein